MLADVSTAAGERLREVRLYVEALKKEERTRPGPIRTDFSVAKGLFFVHLYGAFEYTVTQSVQRSLQLVNFSAPTMRELKPVFWSVALDAECKAVADVGPAKVWPKRWKLFERSVSSEPVTIDDSVFPADGSNLKTLQMESVWRSLSLPGDVVPMPRLRGRLDELTDNRNRIAHGRESPVSVGSRYSVDDLRIRFRDIEGYCSYVIQTLESFLTDEHYKT